MTRERDVEKRLRIGVERLGGLCLKFVSPGRAGVMDRIILFGGLTLFVETKAPGEKLKKLQEHTANEFRARGAKVISASTLAAVDRLLYTLEHDNSID